MHSVCLSGLGESHGRKTHRRIAMQKLPRHTPGKMPSNGKWTSSTCMHSYWKSWCSIAILVYRKVLSIKHVPTEWLFRNHSCCKTFAVFPFSSQLPSTSPKVPPSTPVPLPTNRSPNTWPSQIPNTNLHQGTDLQCHWPRRWRVSKLLHSVRLAARGTTSAPPRPTLGWLAKNPLGFSCFLKEWMIVGVQ